jgi:hypothetical protein
MRQSKGNSAAPNPAVPVRILREVLLAIVGPESGFATEINELYGCGRLVGRLPVDRSSRESVHQLLNFQPMRPIMALHAIAALWHDAPYEGSSCIPR